jgi:hypothetical protein
VNLLLSQLINLLFLVHGDGGSTGNFNVSFAAAFELVGAELIWREPETEKVAAGQFVQQSGQRNRFHAGSVSVAALAAYPLGVSDQGG